MSEETTQDKSTEVPSTNLSDETQKLEAKIEQTEDKIEEVKSNPEYATKQDISTLTAALAEFREELKAKKEEKPKVPAPEKKEEKPEVKKEEIKEESKTEAPTPYGSRRWFGNR